MSDWTPKNKDQAEGFELGKSFVQGFTDKIHTLEATLKDHRRKFEEYIEVLQTNAALLNEAGVEIERLREKLREETKENARLKDRMSILSEFVLDCMEGDINERDEAIKIARELGLQR